MKLALPAPPGFSFTRTVLSHGWCLLSPFEMGRRATSLATTVRLETGRAVRLSLVPRCHGIGVEVSGTLGKADRAVVCDAARSILNLDFDLGPFHAAVRRVPHLRWIARTGTGRLLRSPTVFEDLVKLVLTTNCSWGLTTRMVDALVGVCGESSDAGTRAFPTPTAIAALGERRLREEVRAGYRAPLLARLSERVASGKVDPERWPWYADTETLKKEILSLPGAGPYVAENLLKFLGRPRGLALDSWMRAKYARVHHRGRPVSERSISRRYAPLGEWAGLAVWFDLTSDWFEGDQPSSAWEALT